MIIQEPSYIINQCDAYRHCKLNRPQALNALSYGMMMALYDLMHAEDPRPLLLTGAGDKAFCAGGDIKSVWQAAQDGASGKPPAFDTNIFFEKEYAMNAAMARSITPVITWMDGIVMGGGVGLGIHASHRLVTPRTRWAMPEVKIGFFPDVGTAYNLARAPHHMGMYLGLTGHTIGAADVINAGFADACVPHTALPDLQNVLATAPWQLDNWLKSHAINPPPSQLSDEVSTCIAACFGHDTLGGVVHALKCHAADGNAWAMATLSDLNARSPLSLAITHAHIKKAAHEDVAEVLKRDLFMAKRIIKEPDFMEGVRAVLVDKDQSPRWPSGHLDNIDPAIVRLYLDPMAH